MLILYTKRRNYQWCRNENHGGEYINIKTGICSLYTKYCRQNDFVQTDER